MVNVYVLDDDFRLIAIIDDFFSLQWRRKYFEPGNMEMHCDPRHFDSLRKGSYLYRPDSEYTAIIEETLWARDDLSVKGRFLEALLEGRCLNDFVTHSGKAEDVLRGMVSAYALGARGIPKLALGAYAGLGGETSIQKRGDTLLDACLQVSVEQEISFRLRYDFDADRIFFEVFQGLDRRESQNENPWAIFSESWENIISESYTRNIDHRNFAYVLGTGEEDDVFQIEVDQTNGAPRRELFIEARDIEYDSYTTRAEYAALLRERGLQVLADYGEKQSAECEVDTSVPMDYGLGDICTYVNKRLQFAAEGRVVEILDTIEASGQTRSIVLGREPLNVIKKIRREART